jgi:AraC-like DNA-binding protein
MVEPERISQRRPTTVVLDGSHVSTVKCGRNRLCKIESGCRPRTSRLTPNATERPRGMRYSSHQPAPPLADFISNFWHCDHVPFHPRVRILPSGTFELIVNLHEDEVRIYDSAQPGRFQRFPGIVVSGTYAAALDIDPLQHASVMGIHFRPGGAFPFLGPAVAELANSHLALEVLWGTPAIELRERLCSAATAQKRFQILEETLKARLQRSSEHPAVSLALDIFGPAGIGDSVRAVAKRVGLSERRFIQVFRAQVGLTPKLFCRVLRFQHVRKAVNQAATLNWSQVALCCGYYDQSHLIHDFQEFSGLSPTDYLGQRSNKLFPNVVPDP